jgi:hypothetical protein
MENIEEIFLPVAELLTDKKLKDKDLMTKPVELKAEKSYPINQGDVTFSIGAQASLSAQLFNDENDVDPEGFISAAPSTYISFKPASQAYLKYQAAVLPKANGKGTIQDIGFEFEMEAGVKAAYYKAHGNNEVIRDAFAGDITEVLTIFKLDDVKKLAINDAVSFNVNGKLSAGLKISWSNIFSQSMSALTSSLPLPLTLDINLSPELTASFNVTVSDQFSYFIKRIKADRLFVAVSKIKSSKTTGSLGASIGISFSKPEELEKQLNALVDELIKAIVKKAGSSVEKAIEAVKNETGSAAQNTLIAEVAELLGLTGVTDLITKVEDRWKKLKEDIKASIKKVAEINAELSFTYEYERIKEGKELFAINISDASLKDYHPSLLRFKISDLLEGLTKGSVTDAELVKYVNQTSLTIKKTWGFGFKAFGKKLLEGRDFDTKKTEEEETLRVNFTKQKQVSQQRSVGYYWKLGACEGKWLTEMNAKMKNYSASSEPHFSEVDLSWYLNMVTKDPRVKEGDLRAYFDMGVLWGSIQQHDVNGLVEKYLPLLKNKSATFESKLILSEMATRTVIQQAGFHQSDKTNLEYMARSLAAAMSFFEGIALRTDVQAREEAYAPLWLDYLKSPDQNTRDLASKAFYHLRQQPHAKPDLLALEKNAGFNNQGIWFADVVYTNPPFNAVDLLFKGLSELSTKINANAPLASNFLNATDKLSATAKQSYFVRTLGSFLSRYASQNTMLKKEVQRVFTITYEEAGKEQVVNLSVF